MNWIPERNPVSVNQQGTDVTDKNVRCSLVRTPGLQLLVQLPTLPVRGLFPGERRMFGVGGDRFYEITGPGAYIDRSGGGLGGDGPAGGTIGNDGRPVQCFLNGNQALLISAGQAYCDNGNGPVPCQFSDQLFDLLIDPSDTSGTTLTTSTGGYFDNSDVGRTVEITGGYGFNLISQTIISVDADGKAHGASSWGVPGSGLGTGVEWLGMMTLFDLSLTAPRAMHSTGHAFGPSDIGLTVHISSGTGWTPGDYTVVGLVLNDDGTPSGDALLDRDAGTAGGAADGVGDFPGQMVTASQGAFMDGYFFIVPYPRTKTVFYSAINDGKSWNPLDFFQKANYPDNVAALFADHEELYTMGTLESTQVWRNVGNADNPFAPDQGAVMHIGNQAPFSVVRLGNGVGWIGLDVRRGTRHAYHATGYNPVVVSTPAVEAAWAKYSTVEDAVAYTRADQGHECWVINFPTANATWAYDFVTGWWHQEGWWNGTGWDKIRCWVHCVVALPNQDKHYGGDWESGNIYIVSSDYKTDNGHTIVRRRRAPNMTVENMRRFYSRFEIDCDVLGSQRIFWNRLGNGRDRIWQLDSQQDHENTGTILTLSYSDNATQSFNSFFTQTLDASVDVMLSNAYLNYVDAGWH